MDDGPQRGPWVLRTHEKRLGHMLAYMKEESRAKA